MSARGLGIALGTGRRLPPKEPTDEMVMAAKNLFQDMGIAIENVGLDPRWN